VGKIRDAPMRLRGGRGEFGFRSSRQGSSCTPGSTSWACTSLVNDRDMRRHLTMRERALAAAAAAALEMEIF
jgi:hypothetical protein